MLDSSRDTVSYSLENDRLSYVGHEITRIPEVFAKMHGSKLKSLDLSYNNITNLNGLDQFPVLTHLILDKNQLSDNITFPPIKTLETLSLNNNQLNDLDSLVKKIRRNFPNLKHLSLLGNKACPNQLSDENKDENDYKRYRYFVLHYLKNLLFLDCTPVTTSELQEAAVKGQFMHIKRPKQELSLEDIREEQDTLRYTPLPGPSRKVGEYKGAYGVFKFRYASKQSEGNRFIMNQDL